MGSQERGIDAPFPNRVSVEPSTPNSSLNALGFNKQDNPFLEETTCPE